MHSCLSLFKKWESPAGPLGQARANTGGGGSGRVVLEPNLREYRGTAAFSSMSETSRCPFWSSSCFCYGHVLGWQEARVTEEGVYFWVYCTFRTVCAMPLYWRVAFLLSPECRVVKSTSYTKIASSSRRSTTKSPGPSRRSKSPASTSSGKAVGSPGRLLSLWRMLSRGCVKAQSVRFQRSADSGL